MMGLYDRKHIMIDCETLSTESTAAILSIGAVVFDKDKVYNELGFYVAIKKGSAEANGHVSQETIEWWSTQPFEVREALFNDPNAISFKEALLKFRSYIFAMRDKVGPLYIWSNGSNADIVWLNNAFKRIGKNPPWFYTNEMCFRTLKKLYPGITENKKATAHHALQDAKDQAEVACKILRTIDTLANNPSYIDVEDETIVIELGD